ncbi:MAG TPA: hypothetical protein PLO43_03795 [Chlamydiales bacterium]|nr:hypothetical protein [Chlamydiales bacterium]
MWRIFHLKDKEKVVPPEFEAISERIKNQLLQERFVYHTENYYKKLREQYNMTKQQVDTLIPQDITPFQFNQ